MRELTKDELAKILERHQHWRKEDCFGWSDMKADLRGADLCGVGLRGVDLSGACLCGADLRGADLRGACLDKADLHSANLRDTNLHGVSFHGTGLSKTDLRGADLRGADLRGARLDGADLYRADLREACLERADLRGADLRGARLDGAGLYRADLREACLDGANLYGAKLAEHDQFRLGCILSESIVGYKKTREDVVITAEIPVGAIVFSINGNKCRTNRAKIVDMGGCKLLHSSYDVSFTYQLGQEIDIKDFCLIYNEECASGFHFFKTKEEAEAYG